MTENIGTETSSKPRRCKCRVLAGFVLALLAAVILFLVFPLQYEARAVIQIRSENQRFHFEVRQSGRYDDFVNTQLALMRSPLVIGKALEAPEVSVLPCVVKQKDRNTWLTKRLRVRRDGKSEIVIISIETESEDASEKIVNAVVDAYFNFIDDTARETDNMMVRNLQVEKRRQGQLAQTLQESIRTSSKKIEQGKANKAAALTESLAQAIAAETINLTGMQARRKILEERNEKLTEEVLESFKNNIREQEILIAELEQLYDEQCTKNESLLETEAGIASDKAQLARIDKTLDLLEERILAIQAETRAPGRITPLSRAEVSSEPSRVKRFTIMGVGALAVFVIVLLLGRRVGGERCCSKGR